ncbi:phospholipase, partial [Bacteroides uniformis]
FYTMQDTDVAGWVRSLQLRGIALPENIKDEVFLIIGERRLTPHS